jgi:ribosome-binding factor A
MDAPRARKLADRIAQIVAEMLERRIKDPRLGFVTITEARLTNDLREATVYYTVFGSDQERADSAQALASATGVIRSEVGRQLGLRHTPSLAFVADVLPDTAQRIEELVGRARDADAELARSREGAVPAGDPDPYRKPAEDDDDEYDDEDE